MFQSKLFRPISRRRGCLLAFTLVMMYLLIDDVNLRAYIHSEWTSFHEGRTSVNANVLTSIAPSVIPPVSTTDNSSAYSDDVPYDLDLHQISEYETYKTSLIKHHPGMDLFINKAYFDTRFKKRMIRIFAFQHKDKFNMCKDFECSWIDLDEPNLPPWPGVITRYEWIDKGWPYWGFYYASFFDCRIPKGKTPKYVTLTSKKNRFSYTLPVHLTRVAKKRKDIGVCIKPMTSSVSVLRLVEWFEMSRLVGLQDYFIYTSDLRGSAQFALDYYRAIGLAKIIPYPVLVSILQKADKTDMKGADRYALYQQLFLMALNECLYTFRGLYKYLLVVDIDEFLLPTRNESVPVMLKRLASKMPGSCYKFQTSWHFEEFGAEPGISDHLYTQKFMTSTVPFEVQPKSIIDTDKVITLNFHTSLLIPSNNLGERLQEVPAQEYGYIHHYRGKCSDKFQKEICKDYLARMRENNVVTRYQKDLDKGVKTVLDILQMK